MTDNGYSTSGCHNLIVSSHEPDRKRSFSTRFQSTLYTSALCSSNERIGVRLDLMSHLPRERAWGKTMAEGPSQK
jgi:hypothetical protein